MRPRAFVVLGAAAALALGLAVLARASGTAVWDDAFIAVRYADRLLAEGRLAWQPGGGPTWGLTAPLSLLALVPARLLCGGSAAAAAQLASFACGIALLPVLISLAKQATRDHPAARGPALGVLLVALGLAAPRLAEHMASGMDTTFAMLWGALLLLAHLRADSARGEALVALLGGLAFFARPELALPALALGAARAVTGPVTARRRAALGLVAAIAILAAGLAVAAASLGAPLPLPFFAKATPLYGATIHERYAGVGARELAAYLRTLAPLPLAILAGALAAARGHGRRLDAVEVGLLLAASAHLACHALLVLPVMHYSQRFQFPTLPALVYLSARGVVRILEAWPPRPAPALALTLAGLAAVGVRAVPEARALARSIERGAFGQFELRESGRLAGWDRHWPGLVGLSRLRGPLSVATTEVGYPAVLLPQGIVLDLAGLNETDVALRRVTPAGLIARERPDLVYLPNPDYREMRTAILADPGFVRDYELVGSAGAAIRREGARRDAVRAALAAEGWR
ncbi:MAG: hypothetical protein KJ067_02770 [Vicinamibacteria bacterium]|nr:hypothetical protein [Vicinamibacteria bacterium]